MQLTIMQWNIWYAEDLRHIAAFLKDHPADVICLQELTLDAPNQTIKDGPAFIAKQLGYPYYHKELPLESTDGTKMLLANGIFSRFPITAQRFVWVNQPKGSGGYDDEYRAYVEVVLDVDGQAVTVGTVHMSYTHRFEATPNKARETGLLVRELTKPKERFIFSGDLNAVPDSSTLQAIEAVLVNAGPAADVKTWTTKPFSYNGFTETSLNWRLDYLFTTPDLTVQDVRVLQTEYSDHLPIYATITL